MDDNSIKIALKSCLEPLHAGLFVSSGKGIHVTRTIDSYEIIYVRSGVLHMFEGGRKFEIPADTALLLWPGRRHGGLRPYPNGLSFYWLHFRMRRAFAGGSAFSVGQVTKAANPGRVSELFRLYLDMRESGAHDETEAALLLSLLLLEIGKAGPSGPDASSALVSKIKMLVEARVHTPFGTSDIAAALRLNKDYVGRVFKKSTGMTLTSYAHGRKVGLAKRYLLDSLMNIDEIAAETGFENVVYFRRIFKRLAGCSPGKYRRTKAGLHVNTE